MGKLYFGDMSDCGLPRLEDVLSNIEPTPLPAVGKVAVGGMTTNFPTGLEESPRPGFSLLKGSGDEFDHPAAHNFRRGDRLRHKKTGVHCTFRRDSDGLAEVDYGGGDIARHAYTELEAADGRKAISAALAKSAGFRVGDEVRLPDGSRGKIVKLNHGAAEVKTRTGSVMARVQDLRAAGGLRKNMPESGTEVVLRRNGRDVRATVLYCQADRMVIRFADGSEATVDPKECSVIAEGQLQDPHSLLGDSSGYRFIPRGTAGLSQAAGSHSLLKGVKPFVETPAAVGNGAGSMDDCGL